MHTRSNGWKALARFLVPAAALTMWGCPNQELAPLEPCTVSGTSRDAAGSGVDKVDVLFAIDNSGSMAQEQAKLGVLLPRLIGVLTTGNKNYPAPPAAPTDSFTPAKSLHVGVVTSSLGRPPGVQSPAGATSGCTEDNGVPTGGGGILQFSGAVAAVPQIDATSRQEVKPAVPACAQVNISPQYIAFGSDATSPGNWPTDVNDPNFQNPNNPLFQFSCIATVGVNGCGIEQHLEAFWKALAPSTFNDFLGPDTVGKADTANRGFARGDSVLAIIHVADEDDCSVTGQGAFMWEQGDVQGYSVGVRCQMLKDRPEFAAALQPITRYADGLIGLRFAFPERLVYAGIVGLPQGDAVDYANPDALLALPSMQAQLNPGDPTSIVPVCGSDAPGAAGTAFPGRRAVQLAKAIKERGGDFVLRSICDDNYAPALNLVIDKIAQQLQGACLPRPLQKDVTSGLVTCDVVEILAKDANGIDVGNCGVAGRSPADVPTRNVDGKPRTACAVKQLQVVNNTIPVGDGWYYDDFTEELKTIPGCTGQRVVFTATADLQEGALARVECYQPQPRVTANARGFAAINTPCADNEGVCASVSLPTETMLCEPSSRTCQIACGNDSNCPEGWVCAPTNTAAPENPATNPRFCQNPTCSVTGS
jgi:hypothetical protein